MKKIIYLKIALLTIFASLLFNVRTVEAQTPTYPTWNITVVPVCPSGMVQTQPLRMFRIIWPQMNQGSNDFDCVNDNSSTSKHSETITPKNIINNMQGIYVGLENPIRDGKNANCSEGVSIEPSSITPVVTVIRQGNNPPTGDFVNFAQYMNPYNWMVRWDWNRLTGGNYTINFNLPVSMCGALTTTPIPPTCEIRPACLDVFPHPCLPPEPKGGWCPIKPTITPVPGCTKKPQGDANCDGKINGADYSFWLNRRCTSGCAITNLVADFNGDNKVDDNDYTIWFNNRQ